MKRKFIVLATLVALVTAVLPGSVASANKAPNKPGSPIAPTGAVHAGPLTGTASVDGVVAGAVSGTLSLVVDQTGVTNNNPIVHANLNLPSGFTWNSADVTVTSNEEGAVGVNQGTVNYSGNTLSVSGLSLTDTDGNGLVEFTLLAENADISTTVMTAGSYSVSSQYRTNPNRKIKEQTWVLSTSDLIALNEPEVDECATDPLAEYTAYRLNRTAVTEAGFGIYPEARLSDNVTWEFPDALENEACISSFNFQEFDGDNWVDIAFAAIPYTMRYDSVFTITGEGGLGIEYGEGGISAWETFDRANFRLRVIWNELGVYDFYVEPLE